MKIYIKFIKKFHTPLIALALISVIYFTLNGVKAELSTSQEKTPPKENLTDRPLNIVAVNDNQTQNIESSKEITKTVEIAQAPQVTNIPAAETESPRIKVTMRVNAGSAAGNYPVDYSNGENAYQLLIRIAENNHFSIQAKDFGWGIYLEGIGNLLQDGRDNFWFLYVNGKSSEVGAADYPVKANDLIEWRYHEYWIY